MRDNVLQLVITIASVIFMAGMCMAAIKSNSNSVNEMETRIDTIEDAVVSLKYIERDISEIKEDLKEIKKDIKKD